MTPLTEKAAATAFSRAWNRLNLGGFLDLWAEGCRYVSIWVFQELEGREAIGDYLVGKMQVVGRPGSTTRAELGISCSEADGRPCVCLFQDNLTQIEVAVVFEVENGAMWRFDTCHLELFWPKWIGSYPK